MDIQQYFNIQQYLTHNKYLDHIQTNKEKKRFTNMAKFFTIQNSKLYRFDRRKPGYLLQVLKRYELEPILYMMHNDLTAGHFGREIMFNKIRTRYYWPQMYEDIKEYVKTCDSCQRRGGPSKNNELHPIPPHSPFYQIGIDFIGPLPITPRGNRYIIVAVDMFTKWPEARAVAEATASQVALFLYEEIICRHGCPMKILSDRGSHFNNVMIKELMDKFGIKHHNSTPYHPQTNGQVERFNKTLKESLAKIIEEQTEWDLHIAPVLFAYRTAQQSTTKMTPFLLTYGREAKLPLDDHIDQENKNLIDRIRQIIEKLPDIREKAKQTMIAIKNKQKTAHDKHLAKPTSFDIGQKVLYYDAARINQFSGKLEPKWKGPYRIHEILINGSYRLREIDGRLLAKPVNGDLLKLYHDRQS
jgi:hypothetical protein